MSADPAPVFPRSLSLLPLLCLALAPHAFAAKPIAGGTQGYRDEIGRPPEPYSGPPRSGADIYLYRCAACHAKTTQGAPQPGDNLEWESRARQGMGVLMQHTLEGYRNALMPPRGGCRNCSDAELKAAVHYLLEQSGVTPPP